MPQTVIYGPPATGKTFHAAAFAKLYGCDCVADDHGGRGGKSFRPITAESALILSTSEPADLRKRYPAATLVRIDAARSALGLDPAPVDGFKPPYHDKAARPPVESAIPEIDLDADTVRKTLAQLPGGFTLTEAAEALSMNAPHRTLRDLVMNAGFQPFMGCRGHANTRCYYPISKEARAAADKARSVVAAIPTPACTAMLSHARVSELLDYASVYGEFDENTPVGTRSSHGTILTEGQLHAIIAYRKVLCLMPVEAGAPAITAEQDLRNRMAACPCTCHESRCGSGIEAARYTLALLERCQDPGTAGFIEDLVDQAGPSFVSEALARLDRAAKLDEKVPF